jgi:hypothetical protein
MHYNLKAMLKNGQSSKSILWIKRLRSIYCFRMRPQTIKSNICVIFFSTYEVKIMKVKETRNALQFNYKGSKF